MTTVFLLAHPDDEAFGPAGTIAKLSSFGESVIVVSMCRGDRPGREEVSTARTAAFRKSCELLRATPRMLDMSDCMMNLPETISVVEDIINTVRPDVVYTHNISDVHQDHRVLAEACMIACRPKPGSPVKELYMCEIPSATSWTFGQISPPFEPDTFVDITDYIDRKQEVLSLYTTETYDFPDIRSVESVMRLASVRGSLMGVQSSEAFKQVFRLC